MSKAILLAATAALATMAAQAATAGDPLAQQRQAARYAAASSTDRLAKERPSVNGSDGSGCKVSVTDNTARDVRMTFYKDQWPYHGQAGQACVPPRATIAFAHSLGGTTGGGDLRAELKAGAGCGGDSLQDKVLVGATLAPIYGGGTAKPTITNVGGNGNDFQGTFTP